MKSSVLRSTNGAAARAERGGNCNRSGRVRHGRDRNRSSDLVASEPSNLLHLFLLFLCNGLSVLSPRALQSRAGTGSSSSEERRRSRRGSQLLLIDLRLRSIVVSDKLLPNTCSAAS